MPKLPSLRRRRFLVSRSQTHLVAFQVAYHLLFVAVIAAGLLGPLVARVESAGSPGERVGVARVLLYFDGRIWWLIGVMLVASAIHTVFVTHRVVGPLVRFRRTMHAIGEGRLVHRIELRTRDYLDDEADELNAMSAALVEHVQAVKRSAQRTAESAALALRALPSGDEGLRVARDLQRSLDELGRELEWFECTPSGRADAAGSPGVAGSARPAARQA